MLITVLIPTYRRPQDLEKALEALKQQVRSPDEVIVVIRDIDELSWSFIEQFDARPLPIQTVKVSRSGQVKALNTGLDRAKGDIIAITDDDAAPRPQWLARIEAHFLADETVGGVGGKDWKYRGTEVVKDTKKTVGKLQWFGRIVGNHNLGTGKTREVDFLKGANMSYRRSAIANLRFDERLKGSGAEIHNDLAFSLNVKQLGWKLIYDPLVEVDHYHAVRLDGGQRSEQFNSAGTIAHVHNETLVLLQHLPPVRQVVFSIWAILVGSKGRRGLVQCLRFLPTEGIVSYQKYVAAMQGRWQGWQTWKSVDTSATSTAKNISTTKCFSSGEE